jgi:hypothetical protein
VQYSYFVPVNPYAKAIFGSEMEIAEIVNAATVDASEKIKIIFEGLFKK